MEFIIIKIKIRYHYFKENSKVYKNSEKKLKRLNINLKEMIRA